ncbi:DUF4158 domain-containing protein [Nocardia kruczakiae]|uniref:DUF4158 domain-containing protein n=1 Tax=Nocardia kruczakiae TaxID=261477 RepID=UPI0007A534EA|nr:DUF4158 domain-containing protein [Nocardia kruczakiae]
MRELDQDELIDRWTLIGKEPELVATKRGAAKIGFALMLRFYTEKGRFPRGRSEIHDDAVEYVARQIGVDRTEIAFYDLPAAQARLTEPRSARRWAFVSAASPTPRL